MSSLQGEVKGAEVTSRQLRSCVLGRCADAGLVKQYKPFPKRMKAERNALAGGRLDSKQLQENLRQLRTEKAECTRRIEVSIRQRGSQVLERVEEESGTLAHKTHAEAEALEQAAKRLRETALRQEELGRLAGSVGRVCLGPDLGTEEAPSDEDQEVVEALGADASDPAWPESLCSETLPAEESSALWTARAAAHQERAKEAKAQGRAAAKAERAIAKKRKQWRSMTRS